MRKREKEKKRKGERERGKEFSLSVAVAPTEEETKALFKEKKTFTLTPRAPMASRSRRASIMRSEEVVTLLSRLRFFYSFFF